MKLHGTKERTIPSLSKNVVWWLIGAWMGVGGGVGGLWGGQKKSILARGCTV